MYQITLVEYRGLLTPPTGLPEGPTESELAISLDTLIDRAKKKKDIDITDLGIIKIPNTEQEVVAIFHSIVSKRIFKGKPIVFQQILIEERFM